MIHRLTRPLLREAGVAGVDLGELPVRLGVGRSALESMLVRRIGGVR
jgi:hypothetical protein